MTRKQNEVNLYSVMVPQKFPFGFHTIVFFNHTALPKGGVWVRVGRAGEGAAGAGVKRKGNPPNLLKMEIIISSLLSLLGMANLI